MATHRQQATRIVAAAFTTLLMQTTQASVSADEAKQLGTTLTGFGAEKAGNGDSSIPAYTGGLENSLGYDPRTSSRYADPFKDEKPLYSVTVENMANYQALLSPGTVVLLKTFPGYRLDVYPSHRSVRYPDWVLQNTLKNATTAKTGGDVAGDAATGADTGNLPFAGVPFPIPQTGYEAMWNHLMHYAAAVSILTGSSRTVDASGNESEPVIATDYWVFPWYERSGALREQTSGSFYAFKGTVMSPPAKSGAAFLFHYSANAAAGPKSWVYTPGQRRVRLAPDLTYDSIISDGMFWDEMGGFLGRMDRFDFKLAGKREMLIQYNVFALTNTVKTKDSLGKKFINPETVRWEKHRVWVVDSIRKSGVSHQVARRTFYLDEDSWCVVQVDSYDDAGKLTRVSQVHTFPSYGSGGINATAWTVYDLIRNAYYPFNVGYGNDGYFVRDFDSIEGLTIGLTPQSLQGGSIR